MTEEEKKAIERIDYIQDFIIENGQYNADVEEINYFSTLLNLIQKKDTEINKLNNIIDRMAEKLYEFNNNETDKDCFIPRGYSDINDCVKKNSCKDCIKQYFMKEDK